MWSFFIFGQLRPSLGLITTKRLRPSTGAAFSQGFAASNLCFICCPKMTQGDMMNLLMSSSSSPSFLPFRKASAKLLLTGTVLTSTLRFFISSNSRNNFFCSACVAVDSMNQASRLATASIKASVDLKRLVERSGMTASMSFGDLCPMIFVYSVRRDFSRPQVNCRTMRLDIAISIIIIRYFGGAEEVPFWNKNEVSGSGVSTTLWPSGQGGSLLSYFRKERGFESLRRRFCDKNCFGRPLATKG